MEVCVLRYSLSSSHTREGSKRTLEEEDSDEEDGPQLPDKTSKKKATETEDR